MSAFSSTIFACVLCGAVAAQAGGEAAALERMTFAMGTSLRLEVQAGSRAAAVRASEAAMKAVEAAEQRLSSWRQDSELCRFLAAPVGEEFSASSELCAELRRAQEWCRQTGGAFDPGIGALVAAYDLRGAGRWPSATQLAAARARSGVARLHVRERALVRHLDVGLDAGAFGKGAALDAAARALRSAGARSASLDFGGQLLYVGDVGSQTLDIADPRDRARPAARLRVDAGSVATTCNSERARVVDERRLGHVIDPRTGRPSSNLGSVTVWAASAFDADCLSTACFVLGPDEAIALAERTDGVEVLALSLDPLGHLVMSTSRGLKDHVSLLIDEPGKPRRAVADQDTQPK